MLNLGARLLRAKLIKFINLELDGAFDQQHDPYWTSSTGYNLKSWQAEGYNACGMIVKNTKPHFVESGWGYAARVLVQLEALKAFYRESRADEDGGGVGAVGAVISEVERRR